MKGKAGAFGWAPALLIFPDSGPDFKFIAGLFSRTGGKGLSKLPEIGFIFWIFLKLQKRRPRF